MARVPLVGYEKASPETKKVFDEYVLPRYQRSGVVDPNDPAASITPMWQAWANSPQLMKYEALLCNYMVEECEWSVNHVPLRELMVTAMYRRYRATEYGLSEHEDLAGTYFSREQLDALDDLSTAKKSDLFDDEQRTILAFCEGVLETGDCRLEVWKDIVKLYGYQGAVEMTAAFAFWFMWIPIFSVFRPDRVVSED